VRLNGGLPTIEFDDALFLAASEHCNDIAKNKGGHVSADGKTFPSDRAGRYAQVTGLDDFFVTNASSSLDFVLKLILENGTDRLTNG